MYLRSRKSRNPLTAKLAKAFGKDRKVVNKITLTLRTLLQLCGLCGYKDLIQQP